MSNNVITQVLGGDKKVIDDVRTVGEVKAKLGAQAYQASVNGSPAVDADAVEDGDFVSLSQAVKGGSL